MLFCRLLLLQSAKIACTVKVYMQYFKDYLEDSALFEKRNEACRSGIKIALNLNYVSNFVLEG